MIRHFNKTAVLLTAAALALSLSACGAKELGGTGTGDAAVNSESAQPSPATPSPAPTVEPSPSPVAAEGGGSGTAANSGKESDIVKEEIEVYQTDDQLLQLKAYKVEISYSSPDEKLAAALKALAGDDKEGGFSLWKGVEFKSATVQAGAATADIHIPDESRLGGAGEEMALEAIRKTVFQFKDIQTFDLLVDGQAAESLMGHMELEHPMKRTETP